MIRRSVVAASAVLGVASVGCFGGTLPARELYRLALPDSVVPPTLETAAGARLLPGSLAVAPYATPGLYAQGAIVYRVDDTQYGAYPSRDWAIPLAEMLGVLTEQVLARHPLTTGDALYDPPSRHSRDYVWRGTVREFEEVDRGKDVFAAVRLECALVRSTDDSVIWTGSARLERQVASPTMPNIVRTLSALAGEVVDQLVDDARGGVRLRAAASARRQP